MKILILKNSAGYVDVLNGTYNLQELGLARAFNKKGHVCDVVYYGGKDNKIVEIEFEKNKKFKVYYLKAKNFLKNGIYGKELEKLIKKYDIVHSGGYDQLESWILAKKIPEKLVIYNGTYYSDFNKRYNKKCKIFDKLFLPRYKKNKITFDTKSNLSKKFLEDREIDDVTSIGVGIDLEQLKAKKLLSSDFSDEIESYKKDNKIITYIGRIEPRRNIEFLIDLVKVMVEENNKVKLVIIGKGEAEYKDKIFNLINKYGLKDIILYKEVLKQELLPKIYNLSDVFLLPTRYEIFGMVLLEAMYFGAPVVTTYNGGSDMLIENEKNGIIINEFDVNKWKESIISIFNNDTKNKLMKENAKKKIEKEYTWDVLTDKFIKVFEKKLESDNN